VKTASADGACGAAALLLIAVLGAAPPKPAGAAGHSLFTEVTPVVGLDPSPGPPPQGLFAMPEMTAGGVALFDYDGDGDLDVLQIRNPRPGPLDAAAPNLLLEQRSDGTFADVTADARIGDPGYGQGVAIGDVDNDGDLDVYVTNFGRDAFYRNNGDGTFVEASAEAGFSRVDWSTSASFFDYDRDGDLDLFVAHYVVYDESLVCQGLDGLRDYCGPQKFPATLDALYRNEGDGTFTDVTASAGIARPGRGLGVVTADLDRDGWVDIYVANDGEVNHLWINNGDGSFADEALMRGVGVNAYGAAEASMGVAVGDADGDARFDLFMTHLSGETNTLYRASEFAVFEDVSDRAGFGTIDLPYTGFGCGFFDYDNDGDLDIALANGRVKRGPTVAGASLGRFWSPYAEPNLLLRNDDNGRFADVSALAPDFSEPLEVSRGLAFGDLDGDGDVDVVLANLGGGLRVYRNDAAAPSAHWLRVRAMTGPRDALGAEVTLSAAGKRMLRLVSAGYSYASSNEAVAHFGLGALDRVDALEVRWPDGDTERFEVPAVDRLITVRQGEGGSP